MTKLILTAALALASAIGPTKAELSQEDLAYFTGWANGLGFQHVKTKKYYSTLMFVFEAEDEGLIAFVPAEKVETVQEAKSALLASAAMFKVTVDVMRERQLKNEQKESTPNIEIRKAIPVESNPNKV